MKNQYFNIENQSPSYLFRAVLPPALSLLLFCSLNSMKLLHVLTQQDETPSLRQRRVQDVQGKASHHLQQEIWSLRWASAAWILSNQQGEFWTPTALWLTRNSFLCLIVRQRTIKIRVRNTLLSVIFSSEVNKTPTQTTKRDAENKAVSVYFGVHRWKPGLRCLSFSLKDSKDKSLKITHSNCFISAVFWVCYPRQLGLGWKL